MRTENRPTRTPRRRNGHPQHDLRTAAGSERPPRVPSDATIRDIDARIDERFDGETTKSSVAILLSGFAVLMAAIAGITIFAVAQARDSGPVAAAEPGAEASAAAAADISAEAGEGIDFEPYEMPDPTLPAVPAGEVKEFEIDVYEHVTKVSDDLAPTRVWSYAINGTEHRGTGVSEPLVVNEGDQVKMTLINGGSEAMDVRMPHSIDFHSSEVAPNEAFITIPPGEKHVFDFSADHPGVFMYHCATAPVLHHTGAGMVGAMIVKPKGLAPVDHELWMVQQEFYIGEPGEDADMGKMEAKNPDVIAFNGYANQYADHPIVVGKDESVRMYLMNAGPSIWSAFHVIGTVFDRTVIEGQVGRSAQTVNLAPSQGGWVEFDLAEEGTYPFVTHAFGDMVKGAMGVLATKNAPEAAGGH